MSVNHKQNRISICGYLEAVIGKYFLSGAGNLDEYWYAVYYDASIQKYVECVELTEENLIGYLYRDNRAAFVLNRFLETFKNHTSHYQIHYIGVDSLDEECLECKRYLDCGEAVLSALWIEDDFLNNEQIPFDYEKFELIDGGAAYLNPKHFSVKDFVRYGRLKSCK